MLSRTLEAGLLTQTVDGWRGDAFVAYTDGTAVGLAVKMEMVSQEDAIEVALAVIEHARTTLEAGDGIEAAGGILFEEDGPYLFIDRVDDEINLVVATNGTLGAGLRSILS
jgi:predicted transcriptional regulator